MRNTNNIPIGIKLFSTVIILFTIYYYSTQLIYPLYTGDLSYSLFYSFSIITALFWIDFVLTITLLYAVTIGFYRAKNWTRLYTIFYLSYSALGALTMIYLRWRLFERYLYFVLYVILIVYLNFEHVRVYFKKGIDTVFPKKGEHVYTHGEYTLYTRDVTLRSGRTQTIYFFSKKKPERGIPCDKPNDFIVDINKRTGMPYLKKKK